MSYSVIEQYNIEQYKYQVGIDFGTVYITECLTWLFVKEIDYTDDVHYKTWTFKFVDEKDAILFKLVWG